MTEGTLHIATCQFAVSGRIRQNSRLIRMYIQKAARGGAHIVHFPETALCGYAGTDMPTLDDVDWDLLHEATRQILDTAARQQVWVVLGSIHRLTDPHKPHNCLYLIGPDGKIKDRYDKRFCLKSESAFYSPGDHFVTFSVEGVTCALLICFEVRFPELYRALYQLKVQCVLQSFYNARQQGPGIHNDIMVQSMQCQAASNAFWVSMCNSSAYYCPYGSCFIRPDGKVIRRLARHRTGMMINTVDISQSFYDPMKGFRELAMQGQLGNDRPPAQDPRSRDRTIL